MVHPDSGRRKQLSDMLGNCKYPK